MPKLNWSPPKTVELVEPKVPGVEGVLPNANVPLDGGLACPNVKPPDGVAPNPEAGCCPKLKEVGC